MSDAALFTRLADALEYPGADYRERADALCALVERQRPAALEPLQRFLAAIESLPPARLEEIYAATFDVNPACCLYVGYHLFGESYKRGAFMANLVAEYRACGYEPGNELPDHLAVVLRYLATCEHDEGRSWLLEQAVLPALGKIAKAFDGTENVYGALVRAGLLALRPPGYVPAKHDTRTLPVLGPDHSFKDWNHGKDL